MISYDKFEETLPNLTSFFTYETFEFFFFFSFFNLSKKEGEKQN